MINPLLARLFFRGNAIFVDGNKSREPRNGGLFYTIIL